MSKLKKEAETLRRIMQGYVVTIDSLNQANIALQMERDAMAQQVTHIEERNADLQRRQENMEGIIEAGRVLQAMDLSAHGHPGGEQWGAAGDVSGQARGDDQDLLHLDGEPDCRKRRPHTVPRGAGPGWPPVAAG